MGSTVTRFVRDESGATSIEYALISLVVGIGVLSGFYSLKAAILQRYSDLAASVAAAP
jgi:Flp pilus assembly pilin Flp